MTEAEASKTQLLQQLAPLITAIAVSRTIEKLNICEYKFENLSAFHVCGIFCAR